MSNIIRPDGSIESANTPIQNNLGRERDYAVYRCMITNAYYVDDRLNITEKSSNPQMLYQAVILGGFKEGQLISNIRVASTLGGLYNYHEKVLRKTSFKLHEKPLNKHDGDIVYVTFVQGDHTAPVIIGLGTQVQERTKTGAKKSDGPRLLQQYNGVNQLVNKDGEFLITRKGGTFNSDKGYFIPRDESEYKDGAESFQAKFHMINNTMLWADPNSSIKFEKSEKRFTHIVGVDAYIETIDGKNNKLTREWKNGLKVTEDDSSDKLKIETSGGAEVTVDGGGGKISIKCGSTEVLIEQSGKVSIKADMVDIGANVSDMAVLFTKLAAAYNSHQHQYMDIHDGGPTMGVTMPPVAPLTVSVASQSIKLQE